MKKLCIIGALLIFQISCFAQSWDSLGNGITTIPQSMVPYPVQIVSMISFNSKLYVGGNFPYAGGMSIPAMALWDGSTWSAPPAGRYGSVNIFCNYNGQLIVGGYQDSIAGLPGRKNDLAIYTGNTWQAFATNINASNGFPAIYALYADGSFLYVGGYFSSIGGISAGCMAIWNGIIWTSMGNVVNTSQSLGDTPSIGSFIKYNNDLYAGGAFTSIDGHPLKNIAKWNGSQWVTVGGGANSDIFTMAVYNGDLYVGGAFDTIGNIAANYIAKWDGNSWSAVGAGTNSWVNCLTNYNGNLYIGGSFDSIGTQAVNCIAAWNGSSFSPLGKGLYSFGPYSYAPDVGAITVYNSNLYTGGQFDSAGVIQANNIARWTGPLAVNELSANSFVKIYPNPANAEMNVVIKQQAADNYTFCLYDALGKKILLHTLQNSSDHIATSELPSGLYYYRVSDQKGTILKTGKVMVIH